jgi:predicted  nucleic acid-binding Zn-ribbon protein
MKELDEVEDRIAKAQEELRADDLSDREEKRLENDIDDWEQDRDEILEDLDNLDLEIENLKDEIDALK